MMLWKSSWNFWMFWGLYKEMEDGGIKREWEGNLPAEYVDHVLFCPHITFGACQTLVRLHLFPWTQKHSTATGASPNSSFCWSESARLVRRRGPKRSEWMLHLAAVWPQLSVRRDGIRRDRTAKHKINGKSIFRKSQKYAGCLTSAAWIHQG